MTSFDMIRKAGGTVVNLSDRRPAAPLDPLTVDRWNDAEITHVWHARTGKTPPASPQRDTEA